MRWSELVKGLGFCQEEDGISLFFRPSSTIWPTMSCPALYDSLEGFTKTLVASW